MKAVRVVEFGGPECLRLTDVPDPVPQHGEVRIAVEAIGLGFADVMARQGRYLFQEPGFVPGLELAGEVVEAGSGVDERWLGQKVLGMPLKGGAYAELICMPANDLIEVPANTSAQTAIAFGMNSLVAALGMRRFTIQPQSKVLVRGAGGGIGLMATQLAALRSDQVTATTSSAERGQRLRELGATTIWDRLAGVAFADNSFDVIIDTVTGEDLGDYFDKLTANGQYLLCGGVDGMPAPDFGMGLIRNYHKSPSLHCFSLHSAPADDIREAAAEIFRQAEAGQIQPVIDDVVSLDDVVEATRKLEAGKVFGKLIFLP
jgi:NADPH:quinone reductase